MVSLVSQNFRLLVLEGYLLVWSRMSPGAAGTSETALAASCWMFPQTLPGIGADFVTFWTGKIVCYFLDRPDS